MIRVRKRSLTLKSIGHVHTTLNTKDLRGTAACSTGRGDEEHERSLTLYTRRSNKSAHTNAAPDRGEVEVC